MKVTQTETKPGRKAGKRAGGKDRRAFTSGFPMDGAIMAEALARLFARAEVEAGELAGFRFKPGVHPDWMRAKENREADPLIAMKGVEDVFGLIVDRLLQCASTSPSSRRGQWAGRYLAEHIKRLLSASPGAVKVTWDETRNNSIGLLSGNLAFVDRLRDLLCRGPGKKDVLRRGSDISKFVFQTWRDVFSLWESGHFAEALFRHTRVPVSSGQQRTIEVLDRAKNMLMERKPDGAGIARMVFADLLASMLESQWPAACEEFPKMACVAQGAANRKGMMSSFSAKRDNLRDTWMSIAAGEHGLSRLLA